MSSFADPRYPFRYHDPGPRTYASWSPFGENDPSLPSATVSLRTLPPSTGTTYSSYACGNSIDRVEANRTPLPSGVQPHTWSLAESNVSRFGRPPRADTTNTPALPWRVELT